MQLRLLLPRRHPAWHALGERVGALISSSKLANHRSGGLVAWPRALFALSACLAIMISRVSRLGPAPSFEILPLSSLSGGLPRIVSVIVVDSPAFLAATYAQSATAPGFSNAGVQQS